MSEQQKKARRGFFAGMGLLAAAGVAVKLSATSGQTEAPQQAQAQEPEGNGYRLTEHIKKYYRTTTI